MTMDDLDLLAYEDLAKYGERGENCRKRCGPIDHPMREMVHLHTVCQVADARAAWRGRAICMSDDDYSMPAVNQFLSSQYSQHIELVIERFLQKLRPRDIAETRAMLRAHLRRSNQKLSTEGELLPSSRRTYSR
jgi:hypothetical protein